MVSASFTSASTPSVVKIDVLTVVLRNHQMSGEGLRVTDIQVKAAEAWAIATCASAGMSYFRVVTADQKNGLDEAVWVSPQRMSGTPCFRGTRVPVRSLIDFLEGGETIDEFIKLYPPVSREQVLAVLDFANSRLLECASSLTSA